MKKRTLVIFDLRHVIWAIGRILEFQEEALVCRLENKTDKIDVIFFYEPLGKRRDITVDNHRFYLSRLFPMVFVNQHLGSFMFMDSFVALEKYVKDNSDRYCVYPPISDIAGRVHNYKDSFNRVLDFHRRKGFIPLLSCGEAMVMWACSFIKEKVRPGLPVVVHLRNCSVPSFRKGVDRNSFLDEWLKFFRVCEYRHQNVKFVVIGTEQERDSRFRVLKNVVFSKDYATTAEQDCALIQTSLMFMGADSGPSAMARYCGVPYVYFNVVNYPSFVNVPPKEPLPFVTPLQRAVWEEDTKEVIMKNFTEILDQIDIREWEKRFNSVEISKLDCKEKAKWPNEI